MLSPRKRDNSATGFRRWPFTSVHTWGENPSGWWRFEVYDTQSRNGRDFGSINNLTLILYGTTEMPEHYKQDRKYDMDYNKVHDRAVHEQEVSTFISVLKILLHKTLNIFLTICVKALFFIAKQNLR